MSRVTEGHWVMLRPQLKRRHALEIADMGTREAWHALQTIRRWHEHGHAERAADLGRRWAEGAHCGFGTIERFTFIQSFAENVAEKPGVGTGCKSIDIQRREP